MPVFDAVRFAISRLSPRGWRQLLALHGLHLDAADLKVELTRPLVDNRGESTINRSLPGFEDFCRKGERAIEPGNPPLSLLYHALASPDVYPDQTGPWIDEDFPTLAELDTIENYIYSLAGRKLADFTNPVIAVFAYQYRTGTRSTRRVHGTRGAELRGGAKQAAQ